MSEERSSRLPLYVASVPTSTLEKLASDKFFIAGGGIFYLVGVTRNQGPREIKKRQAGRTVMKVIIATAVGVVFMRRKGREGAIPAIGRRGGCRRGG